ncbi:hypothetical protein FEM03_16725 [Phragmitibacter flavus]|uniref:Uncharacterized protein n=2 Tax=Phragmitibacter flavus TaxID=2576071 RepID=A0A5R8KBB9_9BACT|nr:hypothetical protein FEM03_16725 [Phragmitibacter flavus]
MLGLIWLKKLTVVVISSLLFIYIPCYIYSSHLEDEQWRNSNAENYLAVLVMFSLEHRAEYHAWPNLKVNTGLQPGNAEPINDFSFLNTVPRITDFWGSPYQFVGIVDDLPRFYSFGPDGIDQSGSLDSDDIVSWQND